MTRNDHELTLQINKANQENIFKSKQGTTLTLLKQMIKKAKSLWMPKDSRWQGISTSDSCISTDWQTRCLLILFISTEDTTNELRVHLLHLAIDLSFLSSFFLGFMCLDKIDSDPVYLYEKQLSNKDKMAQGQYDCYFLARNSWFGICVTTIRFLGNRLRDPTHLARIDGSV